MKKLEKSGLNLKAEYNDVSFVESSLSSDNSLRCMYAIRSCVLNRFNNESIIKLLKKLKSSNLVEWNSCKISNCAFAALHLLGIEPYEGNDDQVRELIETVFFTTNID